MTGDFHDLDGDGVFETEVVHDPMTGATVIGSDADGDGYIDTVSIDVDGDGRVDVAMIDVDGDGQADYIGDSADTLVAVEELDTLTDLDPDGDDPFDLDEISTTGYETLDADGDLEDDSVHGEPMADIEYHQAQPGPVDCVPTSISMVLTELTGETVAAADVVDLANELDMMTSSGMSAEDGARLLEEYGVEAEVSSGTLDDLRTALDEDTPVIIGLDSDDLYGVGDGPFESDMQSGHAVVITGIDDEAGMVYINDPGFPDGAGVAIPIDVFEDAWEDSEHTMITATPGEGTGDETDTDVTAAGTEDDDGGWLKAILLPLRFSV